VTVAGRGLLQAGLLNCVCWGREGGALGPSFLWESGCFARLLCLFHRGRHEKEGIGFRQGKFCTTQTRTSQKMHGERGACDMAPGRERERERGRGGGERLLGGVNFCMCGNDGSNVAGN
jgi:hypothetical protein